VHVHRDGSDCLELLIGQSLKIGLETALITAIGDVFNGAAIKVTDKSEVSLAAGN
jgi:hypothetical protein